MRTYKCTYIRLYFFVFDILCNYRLPLPLRLRRVLFALDFLFPFVFLLLRLPPACAGERPSVIPLPPIIGLPSAFGSVVVTPVALIFRIYILYRENVFTPMIRLIQTQKIPDENKFDVGCGLVWINKTQKIIGPMFFLNQSGPPCTQIHLFYQIYSFEYKILHHMYQNKTVCILTDTPCFWVNFYQ